jgi:hypothetical protein
MADATYFEAHYSLPRILLRVGVAALFMVGSLFLVGLFGDSWGVKETTPRTVAIGAACFVLFGFFGAYYLRLLFKGRLSLRIDENGLLDRNVSDLTIPWEHISDIRIRKLRQREWGITLSTMHYIDYVIDPSFERKLRGGDALIRRTMSIPNGRRPTILYDTFDCDFEALTRALRTIPPEHARLLEA